MNFILSIYDHNMVMHMKFCQDFLGNRGVIYCPLVFKMSLIFSVISHTLASNSSKEESHETYTEGIWP